MLQAGQSKAIDLSQFSCHGHEYERDLAHP
jgi:hypothetical protein